jgi:hypothetical protein
MNQGDFVLVLTVFAVAMGIALLACGYELRASAWRTRLVASHLERQRQAAIEQQHHARLEHEAYFQSLAKLAVECGLSQKTALERLKAFSVLARQEREQHVSLTFARFG